MKAKPHLYIVAVTIILLSLSSCIITKGYVGPIQKKESLAYIKPNSNKFIHKGKTIKEHTCLILIDSVFVGPRNIHGCFVMPGTHTIEIQHFQSNGFVLGNYLVTFNTEAGKTYRINAITDPNITKPDDIIQVDIFVTDVDNQQRIKSNVEYRYKLKE